MTTSTQCPQCSTRFKVSQAQLDAHQGLVRCGRCQGVFNAGEYLQDDRPSPQLDLPIAPETTRQTPADVPADVNAEPASATREEPDFGDSGSARPQWQYSAPLATGLQNTEPPREEPQVHIGSAGPITLAQPIAVAESFGAPPAEPAKKKRTWPWLAGSLLMCVILLAQAAYFFRVELAANQPGLKPALISYCRLLHCTVPLPQKADLMSIESSDLEADPVQTSVITLNALLRNHALYTQAYPQLELTLTDGQDKPLARRTFLPAEYLKSGEDEKLGLASNRELGVKLSLDTTDLKPSGYRLFLFYPQ